MTTYQIYNKAAGECLEYYPDAEEHRPWITQPCQNNKMQKLEFLELKDNNYKIKAPETDKYLTVTYKNDWDGFGSHGNDDVRARTENPNNPLRNQVEIIGIQTNTGNYGKKALENGPFKIKGLWQLPQQFSNRAVEASDTPEFQNEILQNWTNTDTPGDKYDKQAFINNELFTTCKSKGLSFNDCSLSNTKSCKLAANNTFKDCPEVFCRTPEGIMTKECQEYARNNPNFDEVVNKHCKENPNDPFCDCYGKMDTDISKKLEQNGIILKKICNDTKCVNSNTAYRTSVMKTQSCSPIQACIQGIDLSNVQGQSQINNVEFVCEQKSDTKMEAIQQSAPVNIPDKTTQSSYKQIETTTEVQPFPIRIVVISGIVVILLLLIFILL